MNKNNYNDISLSTTKNNSNISTNNIINDYYSIFDKKNNKIKLSKKLLKKESSLKQMNLYNSAQLISHYKNKSQIDFYKKNSKKKLPFIYKHLKKSASSENINNNNKFNNFIMNKKSDKIYNPITLYGKYFPSKYSGINNYKNLYTSLINFN